MYVRTSKGNIGKIITHSKWVIINSKEEIVFENNLKLSKEHVEALTKEYNLEEEDKYSIKQLPNQILLGNKQFLIEDDKFTILNKLTIELRQSSNVIEYTLHIKDAEKLISLLESNKLWFKIK